MKKQKVFQVVIVAMFAFAWLGSSFAAPLDYVELSAVGDLSDDCESIQVTIVPYFEGEPLDYQEPNDAWHVTLSVDSKPVAQERAYDLYRSYKVPWPTFS